MTTLAMPTLLVLLMGFVSQSWAEIKTVTKEYTYQASEADSKITSRAIALDQVKKLLLQELGVYVESVFKDSSDANKTIVTEDIVTLTAGVVTAVVQDEKWDGKSYWLKAEIKADPVDVAKSIERLRGDRQKSEELAKLQSNLDEANKRIERLRAEMSAGKSTSAKLGEYNKAVGELSALDWFNKGYIYGEAGQHAEAVFAYEKAIALNLNSAVAYFNLGSEHVDLGNYKKAIEIFDVSLRIEPKSSHTFGRRCWAYHLMGKDQLALSDCNEAISINPRDGEFYSNRGNVLRGLGKLQESLNDFNEGLKLDQNNFDCYIGRGITYSRLGFHVRSLADYDKAIELDSKSGLAFYDRGAEYYRIHQNALAIKDLQMAIDLGDKEATKALNTILREIQNGSPSPKNPQ